MLKTISAALLAISVLAAPAMAAGARVMAAVAGLLSGRQSLSASPPVSSRTNGPQLPSMVATLQTSGSSSGASAMSVRMQEVPVTSDAMPGRQAPEPSSAKSKRWSLCRSMHC